MKVEEADLKLALKIDHLSQILDDIMLPGGCPYPGCGGGCPYPD